MVGYKYSNKQDKIMSNGKTTGEKLNILQLAWNRMRLWNSLGNQYSGDRDLYSALGYPKDIKYLDYYAKYTRLDVAKAVVNKPVEATWVGIQRVFTPDVENDLLEKAWDELYHDLKIKNKLIRLDKLSSIGRYGVLVLGFSDITNTMDWTKPVEKRNGLKLLYVNPYSEDNATINTFEENTTSPRFGLPMTYQIQTISGDGKTNTLTVHHSRVLHITGETLDCEIYGIPVLEAIYNRLMDIEKLVGSSAEMFWRGARPGISAEVDKDFDVTDANLKDTLEDQMQEYEHNMRRMLVNQGVKMNSLAPQVVDPSNHVDVQISMISAETGIPKRILMGSERGELASSQDQDSWLALVQTRREEYADRQILCELVDRLMSVGVLPYTPNYSTEWTSLYSVNEKDKAEIGKTRAITIKEYTTNPTATELLPPAMFYKHLLGFNEEQVVEIEQHIETMIVDDNDDLEPETE